MSAEKKIYSRYIINRGLWTLWKGDPAVAGSRYRSIAITSSESTSIVAMFQVFETEGIGRGFENGKFAGVEGESQLLFDQDFNRMDAASKKVEERLAKAEADGFRHISPQDAREIDLRAASQS